MPAPSSGFVISLDRRRDRLLSFRSVNNGLGIDLAHMSAIDGRTVDVEPYLLNANPLYRLYYDDAAFRGTVGAKLSHELCWEKISKLDEAYLYFVFEDDARIAKAYSQANFRRVLHKAPRGADLIWLNDLFPANLHTIKARILSKMDRFAAKIGIEVCLIDKVDTVLRYARFEKYKIWSPHLYNTCEAYLIRPSYARKMLSFTASWTDAIDAQMKAAIENLGGSVFYVAPGMFRQADRTDTDTPLRALST